MFQKILIANRGEIALRVIRACRELGIKSVAVYSEADHDSLHVRFADESVCIGPPSPTESYLNIPRIIAAAEITGAEAIHPGYGFLAESARFAEICESCNLAFVGPTAKSISLMGDKSAARETLLKEKIPTTPGSDGVIETSEQAMDIANQLGYPVIIKAAAGGGGRGMRIAEDEISLVQGFVTARAEAEKSFNDSRIYIEKYLIKPRHVEIQVVADSHGNAVSFGERDCSLQRRHQKVVEESPSPAVDEDLRKRMGDVAVRICYAVDYRGAGTIEFLLDASGEFYFMEMNTRIQVEHPVSEMVTGVDLIKEQILVAAGEPLSVTQDDIKLSGHSIECRINAEDPDNQFMPCPGKITAYHMPGGPGIRVDSHAYSEYVVPPFYDSLIAKLIVHGTNRTEALAKMRRALDEYIVEGIPTTIALHKRIMDDPGFIKGDIHTRYLDEIHRTRSD